MIKGGVNPAKGTAGSKSVPFFGWKQEMQLPVGIITIGFSTAREHRIF